MIPEGLTVLLTQTSGRLGTAREALNRTSAERSWASDRMRQVKRPRSRRTGVFTLRQVSPLPNKELEGTLSRIVVRAVTSVLAS